MPITYPSESDPHSEKAAFVPNELIQRVTDNLTQGHSHPPEPEEIRRLLAHCQHEVILAWDYWLDDIGRSEPKVAFEDDSYIILNLGKRARPCDYLDSYDGPVSVDDTRENIVAAVHRTLAQELTDEMWTDSYPYVVRKPPLWGIVEEHVIRRIGALSRKRGSVGRGADSFAVDVHGQSQQFWANRTDRTRQAVNNSLNRGKREASPGE